MVFYRFTDVWETLVDICVGEAEDMKGLLHEKGGSGCVVGHSLFCKMLGTINFDDESGLCAVEISDVGAYDFLPAETVFRVPTQI